jgi:6-phosphogluconolactonase (cycloisomerase 2 family)
MKRRFLAGACAPVLLPFLLGAASAQIAISANDGKAGIDDGKSIVNQNPHPDYITIFDLGQKPPKVIGEVMNVPASVVGPPQSVAIAKDASFAIVTGAFKVDPADPKKVVPDNKVTVIDLKAKPAAVIATLEAGPGATGVSINPAGTLALVCNRGEGTVSIFKISGNKLTAAGKLQLGGEKSGPSHAAFTPDGKMAIVTRDGDHRVSILKVDGDNVTDTKHTMTGGFRPYSLEMSPKGDIAVFGNQGGGTGDDDVINVVDLKSNPPRVIDTISVGPTPEGVAMSPTGKYVAVTVMNNTNKAKAFPFYRDNGILRIYSINGKKLTHVTDGKVGHWCQGAVWSRDEKQIVVQCMVEKDLESFSFDGKSLKRNGEIKLKAGGAGMRAQQ